MAQVLSPIEVGDKSMRIVNQLFFKGLIVVLPFTITIYLLVWISAKAEGLFGSILKQVLGPNYIPGIGIAVAFVFLVLVGFLVNNYLTGKLIHFFISKFEKVPFIKAIYNPLKDLMSLFASGGGQNKMQKVVMVNFDHLGFQCIGLVTREEFEDLPRDPVFEDRIAVYMPMSYMLGGFTIIVPRSSVKELNIPVEKAIKLAITGWIKAEKSGF